MELLFGYLLAGAYTSGILTLIACEVAADEGRDVGSFEICMVVLCGLLWPFYWLYVVSEE